MTIDLNATRYLVIDEDPGDPGFHTGVRLRAVDDAIYVLQREFANDLDDCSMALTVHCWRPEVGAWDITCHAAICRETHESHDDWNDRTDAFFDFIRAAEARPSEARRIAVSRRFDEP